MKINKFTLIPISFFFVLALIYFINNDDNPTPNPNSAENLKKAEDNEANINDSYAHQKMKNDITENKLVIELDGLIYEHFSWFGLINQESMERCKKVYDEYIKGNWANLYKLYPRISFYRIFYYACKHQDMIFAKKDISQFIERVKSDLTLEEFKDLETIEKTNTLMAAISRYPCLFENLPKEYKNIVIALSFTWYRLQGDFRIYFQVAFKNNYRDAVMEFMLEVLVDKHPELNSVFDGIIKTQIIKYISEYYDSKYKEQIFSALDYLKVKYRQEYEHFITILTYNNSIVWDDFFDKYFLSNPEWEMFQPTEEPEHYNILTFRKLKYFQILWDKIKTERPFNISLCNRISAYITYRKEFDYRLSPFQRIPFKIHFNSIESEQYKDDIPINEIIEAIDYCFEYVSDYCFIESRTNYIVKDINTPSEYSLFTLNRRKLFKWRYGDVGYGSPTYPTECFIDWDKHKAEFPEYETMRKDYLEFQKEFKK